MRHVVSSRLELFVLAPGEIPDEEILLIESHLASCPGCRNYARSLSDFYHHVEILITPGPGQADRSVIRRYWPKGLQPGGPR